MPLGQKKGLWGWEDTQKAGLLLEELGCGEGRSQCDLQAPGLAAWRLWTKTGAAGLRKEDKFNVVKWEVLRGSRTKPILCGCGHCKPMGGASRAPETVKCLSSNEKKTRKQGSWRQMPGARQGAPATKSGKTSSPPEG